MRRRLYFLLPDTRSARQVLKELLLARIEERHIHTIARDGVRLGELPQATILQKSDAARALWSGFFVGGATGIIAGIAAVVFPPSGLTIGLGIILAAGLIGALMGIWVSGMIAAEVPNSQLRDFREAIDDGKVLMIVDVPKRELQHVSRAVRRHHPEADMRGVEPTMPAFP